MDYMMRLLQRLILIIGMVTLGTYALVEKAGEKMTMMSIVYSIVFFILAFILVHWFLKVLKKILPIGELVFFKLLKLGTLSLGLISIVQVLGTLIRIDQQSLWLTFIFMGEMYALADTYNNRRMIESK